MADILVNKRRVAPLADARVRNVVATAAGSVGDVVYIHTDSGARQADGSAVGTADVYGIVTAVNCDGMLDFVAGDALSVVVDGPVCGFASGASGRLYLSDTAGKLADVAGTVPVVVAQIESPDVIYVRPHLAAVAVPEV